MQLPLVPGVYPDQRPAPVSAGVLRTDVCGFVGFEPRVRDAGSHLLGDPPIGHRFAATITRFQVRIDGERRLIEEGERVLSASPAKVPLPDGGSQAFALIAVAAGASAGVQSIPGVIHPDGHALAPADEAIESQVLAPWVRLVDVRIQRADQTVRTSIVPRLPPQVCDDWEEYQTWHGPFDEQDLDPLARTVRSFFANGGRRCYIATIQRPDPGDADGLREAALAFAGTPGSSEREATGLARLLLIDEVALVSVPSLHARRMLEGPIVALPPSSADVCFRPCNPAAGPIVVRGPTATGAPLLDDSLVLEVQRRLMARAGAERWRIQLLLSVPMEFDPTVGDYRSPSHRRALTWRASLAGASDDAGAAATALYHPWLLAADREGGEPIELPPDGFAAGVIARRDLRRGPAIAAANEPLIGALGPARSVGDDDNAALYSTPVHINVARAFPGRGVLLWGARTQSSDTWLRYLNIRRGLSAIERRMALSLRPLTFEPNTPALWVQMTQLALGVLMELFQQGALRGATPGQAFWIRCDETNNPPEQIALGRVVCEVGVAIAAPAEFIVFRVSRADALLSVEEAA